MSSEVEISCGLVGFEIEGLIALVKINRALILGTFVIPQPRLYDEIECLLLNQRGGASTWPAYRLRVSDFHIIKSYPLRVTDRNDVGVREPRAVEFEVRENDVEAEFPGMFYCCGNVLGISSAGKFGQLMADLH